MVLNMLKTADACQFHFWIAVHCSESGQQGNKKHRMSIYSIVIKLGCDHRDDCSGLKFQ